MDAPSSPKPVRLPRLRVELEDFVVDEVPLYAPSGEGGHTFVRVEKRGLGTEEVARALARAAGVAPAEVGYAGRKDRRAIARQWFSVPGLEPERARALALPGIHVLEAARHRHRLRTGQLRANAFEIAVRGVGPDAAARARDRLEALARVGMPNRFGAQRFGRAGDNAERGLALLDGRLRLRDRRAARFLVSALQAAVFNEALARRALPLDAIEAGDVAEVVASGGLFAVEDVAREGPRAAAFEISATGPLFGLAGGRSRDPVPFGAPAEREAAALAAFGLHPGEPASPGERGRLRPPPGLRVRGARRALRVRVGDAGLAHEGDVLRLRFVLPAGSYATVLVEDLIGPFEEASAGAAEGQAE